LRYMHGKKILNPAMRVSVASRHAGVPAYRRTFPVPIWPRFSRSSERTGARGKLLTEV